MKRAGAKRVKILRMPHTLRVLSCPCLIAAAVGLCLVATGTAHGARDGAVQTSVDRTKTAPAAAAQKVDVNKAGPGGATPLMTAAMNTDSTAVESLISAGADVDKASGVARETPLIMATQRGSQLIVDDLLHAKANPNIADISGTTALIVASEMGRDQIAASLLAAGANPNEHDQYGQTALMRAAYIDQFDIVKSLLAAGVDQNATDQEGRTALMWAAEGGDADIVQALLDAGGNRNAVSNDGENPIMHAAHAFRTDALDLLLKMGFDQDGRLPDGRTPLLIAAQSGSVDVVDVLLDRGVDIRETDNKGRTALILAAASTVPDYDTWRSNIDVVQELIDRGADVNATDKTGANALDVAVSSDVIQTLMDAHADVDNAPFDGDPPLVSAARRGDLCEASKFLQAGANVNAAGKDGDTPLIAAARASAALVDFLIKNGADIKARDGFRQTALIAAVFGNPKDGGVQGLFNNGPGAPILMPLEGGPVSPDSPKIVKRLIAAGVDIDAVDARGETALDVACENNEIDAARALIEAGANVEPSERSPYSPLVFASSPKTLSGLRQQSPSGVESLDLVKALLAAHADPNIIVPRYRGLPPLAAAAVVDRVDIVETLLKAHAKVDVCDYGGETPLMEAAQAGRLDAVDALLTAGADVNARDDQGVTPLHYACRSAPFNPSSDTVQENEGVIARLIAAHADCNAADNEGRTPLFDAVGSHSPDILKAILADRPKIDVYDVNKNTPLTFAMEYAPELVPLLARKGHVEERDGKGQTPLMIAARIGNVDAVRSLLGAGARSNEVDDDGQSVLLKAVTFDRFAAHSPDDKLSIVRLLIGHRADPNIPDSHGVTPLAQVFYNSDVNGEISKTNAVDIARALLAAGAKVESAGDHQPLFAAAATGNADGVKLLVDAGADPAARNAAGDTALISAAASGDVDTARYFLGKVDDETQRDRALAKVRGPDDAEVAKLLVDAGVSANQRAKSLAGINSDADVDLARVLIDPSIDHALLDEALLNAAGFGQVALVKLLLASGADKNTLDSHGQTPLIRAAASGASDTVNAQCSAAAGWLAPQGNAPEVIKALLDADADQSVLDNRQTTALMYAAGRDGKSNSTRVKLLINAGADQRNKDYALIYSARCLDLESVQALLSAGANPNATITHSRPATFEPVGPPLIAALQASPNIYDIYAVSRARLRTVRLLLTAGARLDVKVGGDPLLIVVSAEDDAKMVSLLISLGVDVDQTDKFGATALWRAARSSSVDVVRVLIATHANVNAVDKSGHSSLWAAEQPRFYRDPNQQKIIDLLKAAGATN